MKILLPTPPLAIILGLALAGVPNVVHAQSTVTTPAPAAAPVTTTPSTPVATKAPVTKTEFKGKLLAIDTTANTITIKSSKTKLVLTITSATIIQKDKEAATLTDFEVGSKVTGSYSTNADGTLIANSLRTKTPKAPKSSSPATTSPETPATATVAPAPAATTTAAAAASAPTATAPPPAPGSPAAQ